MNYIPVLPQKDSSIKEIPEITAKKIFDQSCDILAAAVSESQIDMDDFSAFENISKRHITVTDPNFQLTHGRDISENLTLSETENNSLNPRENRIDYPTNTESLKENEKPISTLGVIEIATFEQKNTKYICTLCNKAFVTKSSLKTHIESVHEGKRPHKCNKCELRLVKISHLNSHLESVHEKNKPFKCEICDYSCSQKFNLKRHFELVHEKTKLDYPTTNKESLKENEKPISTQQNATFQQKNAKYICTLCNKLFVAKSSLKGHIESVHEGKRPQKCNKCELRFVKISHLNAHLESVHEKKKPFKCEICGYSCSRKFNLKRHFEGVHEKTKLFKCDICKYTGFQKGYLKWHLESVHLKNKPFRCDICDYRCSQKGDLKKHIESVHEKKKPFKCTICDHNFSLKSNMKIHLKTVHKKKKPLK